MARQTGTIQVAIEYDDDSGETTFSLPSGFENKMIVVNEDPTGDLSVNYKKTVSPLYDDPQITDEDFVRCVMDGLYEPASSVIEDDVEVSRDDDGALVRCWVFVESGVARQAALDRQARDFNRSRMTEN